MAAEKCGNCQYRKQGECRRQPPQFVDPTVSQLASVEATEGVWPKVAKDEWCGEWKQEE